MSSWWEQTDNYPDRKLLAALLPSYQEQIIETLQNLCYNQLKEMFGIFPNMIFFDEKCVFSAVDFGARYKDLIGFPKGGGQLSLELFHVMLYRRMLCSVIF